MSMTAQTVNQGDLPLSHELLTYYQARVAASEDEMASLRARIDEVAVSKEEAHKMRWELQKRNAEVAELQCALSDSHVYVWEERDKCQRMQAENDELRIQEAEDRRKIQHLLSLVEPLTHDSTFVRTQPPETPSPSPHPLGAPVPRSRPPPFPTSHSRFSGGRQGGAGAAGGGWAPLAATQVGSGGAAAQAPRPAPADTHSAPPGPGVTCGRVTADAEGATRVLRTLYMPNEKIDSLLLSIESLRAQLQEQASLSRERVSALLEDRRLRIAEDAARRATEAQHAQAVEEALTRSEALLVKHTRDYLALRHESLIRQRTEAERVEELRQELNERNAEIAALRSDTANEVQHATLAAKQSADDYVNLFRKQVTDTERTMGLLTAEHASLQQALGMRVKELEDMLGRLQRQHSALESRRRLEGEGYSRELALVQKQLAKLELRFYGKPLPPEPAPFGHAAPSDTSGVPARRRARSGGGATPRATLSERRLRSELGVTRARMTALERAAEA